MSCGYVCIRGRLKEISRVPFGNILPCLSKQISVVVRSQEQSRYTSSNGRYSLSEKAFMSARHLSMNVSRRSRKRPSGCPDSRPANSNMCELSWTCILACSMSSRSRSTSIDTRDQYADPILRFPPKNGANEEQEKSHLKSNGAPDSTCSFQIFNFTINSISC